MKKRRAGRPAANPPEQHPAKMVSEAPVRLLMIAHLHPAVSKGGAEIAAYQLYNSLRSSPEVEASWFLAASGGRIAPRLGARLSQPFGPDEYVYAGAGFDHFTHSNPDPEWPGEFSRLLEQLRPTVVHFHHYTNLGLDTLLTIRRVLPAARIVVTLHEYLGICNHFGQMVKRPSLALCDRASPRDCNRCFPEKSEQDFFLRELFIKRFFRLVDAFVSPSQFLADRYIAWGIDPARMTVIENGLPAPQTPTGAVALRSSGRPLSIGFFGQISRLKGIDVLFDAAALLEEAGFEGVEIDVHGDHSGQPPEFRALFEARLQTAAKIIHVHGPYENSKVHDLMLGVDAVIVPSIWWENSPLVIQEALLARRPVICSDIGGMSEKVRNGLDGFHFRAGNARSLATLLSQLATEPARLLNLASTLAQPRSLTETSAETLALYRSLPVDPDVGGLMRNTPAEQDLQPA
ncbi:glycosyltransferase [Roseomonas nepalensis]|uniref:Glycosyltransferase n=1 Tax=Muricoccus nepalensis TaxID=1854500 RepID=A0A502ER30_9PROT|nr:glycosyltransferase family 4 protein [Roseomonas nepalensis]TPG40275.1 glycosyltransferase [Roseomonas nepalensis]